MHFTASLLRVLQSYANSGGTREDPAGNDHTPLPGTVSTLDSNNKQKE
jgi:hypothetical protein